MEYKVVVVVAVGLLGLLSFGAGFGAEVTRAKVIKTHFTLAFQTISFLGQN